MMDTVLTEVYRRKDVKMFRDGVCLHPLYSNNYALQIGSNSPILVQEVFNIDKQNLERIPNKKGVGFINVDDTIQKYNNVDYNRQHFVELDFCVNSCVLLKGLRYVKYDDNRVLLFGLRDKLSYTTCFLTMDSFVSDTIDLFVSSTNDNVTIYYNNGSSIQSTQLDIKLFKKQYSLYLGNTKEDISYNIGQYVRQIYEFKDALSEIEIRAILGDNVEAPKHFPVFCGVMPYVSTKDITYTKLLTLNNTSEVKMPQSVYTHVGTTDYVKSVVCAFPRHFGDVESIVDSLGIDLNGSYSFSDIEIDIDGIGKVIYTICSNNEPQIYNKTSIVKFNLKESDEF